MASTILESEFYGDGWSTPEMRAVFDDRRRYQRWLDIEAALARVQGDLGVIPAEAAREIARQARLENIDLDRLKAELRQTQHSLVPLLRGLQRACAGGLGEYVHYGPTTQDIEDTGAVLELRDALGILLRDLRAIEAALMELSLRHRDTTMCGRTHGQQALPITLGLKFAVWVSEIRRHIERFKEMKPRLFVGMLHGGAGSMAGLGPRAMETIAGLMRALDLGVPDVGWGNARDNLAEYATHVAMAAGTIGKLVNEIFELGRTEIGEFAEALPEGYVGSSTMPHKRNPEICEQVVMLSRVIRAHALVAMEAIQAANERDSRSWRTDWWSLPECSMLFAAMLAMTKRLVMTMEIHEDRLAANLDRLRGLLLSEGLMFQLGEKIGKQTAHHVIGKACLEAHRSGRSLREVLQTLPEASAHLSPQEIDGLLDYRKHIGFARELVDQVCRTLAAARKTDGAILRYCGQAAEG